MLTNNVIELAAFKPIHPRSHPRLSSSSRVPIESLFGSRVYALSKLHADMLKDKAAIEQSWLRSVRPFTQRFCKITREFSGISQEDLCERLNQHPRILSLKKLPGGYRFYPITPEFLTSLENSIMKIIEYNPYGGGFLGIGAYGVPTQEVASVIAEVCGPPRDYRKFEEWCHDYLRGMSAMSWL